MYDLVRGALALLDRSGDSAGTTAVASRAPNGAGLVCEASASDRPRVNGTPGEHTNADTRSSTITSGGDRQLAGGTRWPGILRAFELRLLRSTGYEAVLDRCTRCGSRLGSDAPGFAHPARGGVWCGGCRSEGRTYVTSPQTLRRLRELQAIPFDTADGSEFLLTPGVAAEARVLVRGFLATTLGAPLASERLLESL
jgi:hypothetical protein